MILLVPILLVPWALVGYLCGSALIGLGVGLAVFVLAAWAESTPTYRIKRRSKRRKGWLR